MGSQLSAQQRSIYSRVREILDGGNVTVSNKILKQFVCWLSLHFLQFTLRNVDSVSSRDKIGDLWTFKMEQGDDTVPKFLRLFLLIRYELIKREVKGQPKQTPPIPLPLFPNPLPLNWRGCAGHPKRCRGPGTASVSLARHVPISTLALAGGDPGDQNQEEEATPSATHVIYSGRRNGARSCQPFSCQNKTEMCKTQREFGQAMGIIEEKLKATLTSHELVLADL